jgi:hypothetical protein
MEPGMIIMLFGAFVLFSILFYYFMYRQYRAGQQRCSVLYPGKSLKMMRLQEQCKDNKRGIWAFPAAASLM